MIPGYGPALTKEDHLNGTKLFTLRYRWGETEIVTLSAPSRQTAQRLQLEMVQSQDSAPLLKACLPSGFEPKKLNQLVPACAAELENLCFEFTFGVEILKKTLVIAEQILNRMGLSFGEPK